MDRGGPSSRVVLAAVAAAVLMACDRDWDVGAEIDVLRGSLTPPGGRVVELGPVERGDHSVQAVRMVETPQCWEESRSWVREQLPEGYAPVEGEGALEFRKVMQGDVARLILDPRQQGPCNRIVVRFSSAACRSEGSAHRRDHHRR